VLLAGPIFGAIATDVGGFGALCWASVRPVRDFGTMMVVGSLLVIPATCLLAPALALFAASDRRTRPGWGEVHIGYWLMRSVDAIRGHPKTVTCRHAPCRCHCVVRRDAAGRRNRFHAQFSAAVAEWCGPMNSSRRIWGGAGVWDVVVPRARKRWTANT